MKVLLVHNAYRQPGGEDAVVADETRLLEERGHQVVRDIVGHDAVARTSPLALAAGAVWHAPAYRRLRALIRRERPGVAHFHNTVPLISPAGYYAAHAEGVPVVQTLHNYRLLCPSAVCSRGGRVCRECVGRAVPWPSIRYGCYRGSRLASGVMTAMLSVHRALGTWQREVDVFVAPTDFARRQFVEGGLPAEKIVVKPHFVDPDPGAGSGRGGYALFAGRLSEEKGVHTLLGAWRDGHLPIPLTIVGDGPLAPAVASAASEQPGIDWVGSKPASEVSALLGHAACLVFPSQTYETFGRVIVEAFARGTPVIASRLGAAAELVHEGRTGALFAPGDHAALAERVAAFARASGAERAEMRRAARMEFEAHYTASANYEALMAIYERASAGGRAALPGAARTKSGRRAVA